MGDGCIREKELNFLGSQREQHSSSTSSGTRVTLRCDSEPAIEALARQIAHARQEGSQTVPERPPVGESQSNGIIGVPLDEQV